MERTFEVTLVFDVGDERAERTDLEPLLSLIVSHAPDLRGVEAQVRETGE